MSLDRSSRDQLADLIERYLDEQITAFAFDEKILEIADGTVDQTVRHVGNLLWYYYDDCTDHKVVLSKQDWDLFQRLLLLLRSDGELKAEARYLWSFTQAAAGIALAAFVGYGLAVGFQIAYLIFLIPLAATSRLLSHFRGEPSLAADEMAIFPFASVGQVRNLRRKMIRFSKRPYPGNLESRTIRDAADDFLATAQMNLMWFVNAPLVLAWQMFPTRTKTFRVVTS
jgi:hypothetical protein